MSTRNFEEIYLKKDLKKMELNLINSINKRMDLNLNNIRKALYSNINEDKFNQIMIFSDMISSSWSKDDLTCFIRILTEHFFSEAQIIVLLQELESKRWLLEEQLADEIYFQTHDPDC